MQLTSSLHKVGHGDITPCILWHWGKNLWNFSRLHDQGHTTTFRWEPKALVPWPLCHPASLGVGIFPFGESIWFRKYGCSLWSHGYIQKGSHKPERRTSLEVTSLRAGEMDFSHRFWFGWQEAGFTREDSVHRTLSTGPASVLPCSAQGPSGSRASPCPEPAQLLAGPGRIASTVFSIGWLRAWGEGTGGNPQNFQTDLVGLGEAEVKEM